MSEEVSSGSGRRRVRVRRRSEDDENEASANRSSTSKSATPGAVASIRLVFSSAGRKLKRIAKKRLDRKRVFQLLAGLPAVLVAMGVIGASALALITPRNHLVDHYRQSARDAQEKSKGAPTQRKEELHRIALVCFERAMALGDSSVELRYDLAEELAADGQNERARAIMRGLVARNHGQAHLWLANDLLQSKNRTNEDVQDAMRLLLSVKGRYPDNEDLNYHLGRLYFLRNQGGLAEPYLLNVVDGKLTKRKPSLERYAYARFSLAKYYKDLGKPDDATYQLQRAAERFSKDVADDGYNHLARLLLAETYLNLGMVNEGRRALEQGLEMFPKETKYAIALGHVYKSQARQARARADQAAAIDLWRESLATLQPALAANPSSKEIKALLIDAYWQLAMIDKAEPLLLEFVKGDPLLHAKLATVYYLKGDRAKAEPELKLAKQAYDAYLKEHPKQHFQRLTWIQVLTLAGEYDEAERNLKEGEALAKFDIALSRQYRALGAIWRLAKATTLEKTGKSSPRERIALYQDAIRLDPGNGLAIHHLLRWSLAAGPEAEEARAALDRLPDEVDQPARMLYVLGDAWGSRKNYQQAVVCYERAYQIDPQLGDFANNYAWTLAEMDPPELSRALDIINAAFRARPDYDQMASPRHTRGHIYMKLGEWKRAAEDFEVALQKAPTKVVLLNDMIIVYDNLEQPERVEELKSKLRVVRPTPTLTAPDDPSATPASVLPSIGEEESPSAPPATPNQ